MPLIEAKQNFDNAHMHAIGCGLTNAKTDGEEIYLPVSAIVAKKTNEAANEYMNAILRNCGTKSKSFTIACAANLFWTSIVGGHNRQLFLVNGESSDDSLLQTIVGIQNPEVLEAIHKNFCFMWFGFAQARKGEKRDCYFTKINYFLTMCLWSQAAKLAKIGHFKQDRVIQGLRQGAFSVIVCPYKFCMDNKNLKSIPKILKNAEL